MHVDEHPDIGVFKEIETLILCLENSPLASGLKVFHANDERLLAGFLNATDPCSGLTYNSADG